MSTKFSFRVCLFNIFFALMNAVEIFRDVLVLRLLQLQFIIKLWHRPEDGNCIVCSYD